MEDNKNYIGGSLAQLREIAGLTQAQAAKLIGSSDSQISKVENGSIGVTNKWIGNAFSALGKAVADKPKATL